MHLLQVSLKLQGCV